MRKIRKYFFKLFLLPLVNDRYLRTPAVFESVVAPDPEKLFILVTGFNEPELIMLHWRAMKKFCRDEFEYFVIDNSNQAWAAERINIFCIEHHIQYVRLPKNPGLDGSLSHGFALNWAYRHLIARFQPRRFGVMDSDLFPTKSFSVISCLDRNEVWGIFTERRPFLHLWQSVAYLWAGCAFFNVQYFHNEAPNFLPGFGVDTGGRIPINLITLKRLPEVYDLHRDRVVVSGFASTTPGESPVYAYGVFVHLTGASWQLGSTDAKRRWIEKLLK